MALKITPFFLSECVLSLFFYSFINLFIYLFSFVVVINNKGVDMEMDSLPEGLDIFGEGSDFSGEHLTSFTLLLHFSVSKTQNMSL